MELSITLTRRYLFSNLPLFAILRKILYCGEVADIRSLDLYVIIYLLFMNCTFTNILFMLRTNAAYNIYKTRRQFMNIVWYTKICCISLHTSMQWLAFFSIHKHVCVLVIQRSTELWRSQWTQYIRVILSQDVCAVTFRCHLLLSSPLDIQSWIFLDISAHEKSYRMRRYSPFVLRWPIWVYSSEAGASTRDVCAGSESGQRRCSGGCGVHCRQLSGGCGVHCRQLSGGCGVHCRQLSGVRSALLRVATARVRIGAYYII